MNHHRTAWFGGTDAGGALTEHLVSNLAFGRIRTVAFVVPSDVSWTLPLYDVAIATARRGWKIGIDDARYWLITPEPEPIASLGTAAIVAASQRLEPEGITFIGSTYSDVRDGRVLLDPQGETIEADLVVSLDHRRRIRRDCRPSSPRPPVSRLPEPPGRPHRPSSPSTTSAGDGRLHWLSRAPRSPRQIRDHLSSNNHPRRSTWNPQAPSRRPRTRRSS